MRLRSEDGANSVTPGLDAELFQLAAIGMAVASNAGRFLAVNPKLCSILGHSARDLASSGLYDVTHPEDWTALAEALDEIESADRLSFSQRQRCLAANGAQVWVDLTVGRVANTRAPGELLAQFVDVTAEVENLQTLHASAQHFKVLSDNSTDVVAQTDPQGMITWVSPSVTSLLGWESGLLAGRAISAFVAKPDLAAFSAALNRVRSGEEVIDDVVRFRTTSGAYRFMSVTARRLTVEGYMVTGMAFGLRDVTEELRAKRELARSEEQFRMAMHGAPEGVAVADSHDRIVQANQALCDLMGTTPEGLIGHRFREFIPEDERGSVEEVRNRLLLGESESVRLEHRLLSAEAELWVDHSVGILRDDSGGPRLFVHQFADRTETRRMQADLTFRATHDVQTGLANRASLLTRLEARLGITPDPDEHVGVLFCDIDNLKSINDQYGHRIGDIVISSVAERLSGAVRHADIVGRIGGDEFVIVLDQCPDEDVLISLAENVQKAANGFVLTDDGTRVQVTVSVGATLASASTDTDDALSRADHALYQAKSGGRNQVALSTEDEQPMGGVGHTPR